MEGMTSKREGMMGGKGRGRGYDISQFKGKGKAKLFNSAFPLLAIPHYWLRLGQPRAFSLQASTVKGLA